VLRLLNLFHLKTISNSLAVTGCFEDLNFYVTAFTTRGLSYRLERFKAALKFDYKPSSRRCRSLSMVFWKLFR